MAKKYMSIVPRVCLATVSSVFRGIGLGSGRSRAPAFPFGVRYQRKTTLHFGKTALSEARDNVPTGSRPLGGLLADVQGSLVARPPAGRQREYYPAGRNRHRRRTLTTERPGGFCPRVASTPGWLW